MTHRSPPYGLVNRRHFLRGVGACLALPFLESLARGQSAPPKVQRLVCVANPFGMIHDAFFPTEAGLGVALPENLKSLEGLRGKFTVFTNLDHGFGGGHGATHAFLSGVRSAEAASMPDGNVTLDQFCGERCAGQTRFPVLNTSSGSSDGGGVELSWTRSGVMVPSVQKVSRVFEMLFVDDPGAQAGEVAASYDEQGSILDTVNAQARAMNRRLSRRDQEKLDQYFTSVRQVEKSLQDEKAWLSRPRPKVDMKEPHNGTVTQQIPILFELIALALQTDSTRVATLEIPGAFDCAGVGMEGKSYHGFSHHGKDPALMAGLRKVERYQIEHLAGFVKKLAELDLLDSTQVLFGSGMSDGSAHTNKNLPVILAGGGYKHQTHIVTPEEGGRKVPLCNLYLTMAQRFGVETASFGISKGTINGLT
jgi:hypothetical protein